MKKIIITGGSSGIGAACAKLAVQKGHTVLITGRREDRLKKLADELGEAAHYMVVDVQQQDSVEQLFTSLEQIGFSDFDVLINNAGLALNASKAPEMPFDDWNTMIQTNVTGMAHVAYEAIKALKSSGSGQIINIGSVSGHIPYPGANVYGATKAFVRQFSLNLRTDLLGTGIRVNNIEPGAVETEFSDVRFKGDISKAKSVYEGYRALHPEDIANGVLWIIEQPDHVNIDNIEIMPTDQTYAGTTTASSS